MREFENNCENEGFDEYEDRGLNVRVKSIKYYDFRGLRCLMDFKFCVLVCLVLYE